MHRFYIPNLDINKDISVLEDTLLINQLTRVLRVSKGFQLILFDGEKTVDGVYEVIEINKRNIQLKKISEQENTTELGFELNIVQGIPNKMEKIEYILQKGVEIGVQNFHFFRSDWSQKLYVSENKMERLQRIIIEAVEQSGRSCIPNFYFHDTLDFKTFQNHQNILLHHIDSCDAQKLKSLDFQYQKGINIVVGPEGGFSEKEVGVFESLGFQKVYLGGRILRTETAGVVVGFYVVQNK